MFLILKWPQTVYFATVPAPRAVVRRMINVSPASLSVLQPLLTVENARVKMDMYQEQLLALRVSFATIRA